MDPAAVVIQPVSRFEQNPGHDLKITGRCLANRYVHCGGKLIAEM
jgi:hypothetical protein